MRQDRITKKPTGKQLKSIPYNRKNLRFGDKIKKNPDGTLVILREEDEP